MELIKDGNNLIKSGTNLLTIDTGGGGGITVNSLSVTSNGTYTAPSGTAYSPVTVNVASTPTESKTVTPNAAGQTVTPSSGKLLSSVVINGDSDLTAANVKKGVEIFGVTGTYEGSGGGGGKVIQYNPTITQVKNKTSYTTCNCSITVEETGTYKCTWVHWAYAAGSSSTYATQLYRAGSAIGSAHSSPIYSNATGSNFIATENNVSLTAGQTIEVRARTRSGSSYYTTAGMLVIEKVS